MNQPLTIPGVPDAVMVCRTCQNPFLAAAASSPECETCASALQPVLAELDRAERAGTFWSRLPRRSPMATAQRPQGLLDVPIRSLLRTCAPFAAAVALLLFLLGKH